MVSDWYVNDGYQSVVPARGGAEVAFDLTLRDPFHRTRTCIAVRQPGPCVRALFELVALLLSKNMTCAQPRCNAKSSEQFLHSSHSSHALHASRLHFTLHTSSHLKSSDFFSPHVTSSQLFSSLPIPSHMSSKQDCFHLIRELRKFISTHLSSSASQKALTVRKKSFAQKTLGTESFCAQKLWDTDPFTTKNLTKHFVLQSFPKVRPSTTLYYKACTKHVPVILCITKLAQSMS